MNNKIYSALTLLFSVATLSPVANAANVLGWDLAGDNSPTTKAAEVIDTNLNPSVTYNTLSRTGLTLTTANNSFNSNNWNISNTFDQTSKYISFSLLPKSGYEMTLESLSYVMNGSNTAPGTGRWGFRIGTSESFTLQNTFAMAFALPSSSAVWDFTDFTTSDVVEFRFWVYGASSINGGVSASTGSVRIGNITGNDLVLNGSVTAVPEPSVSSLLLGGLFGLAGLRFLGRKRIN
jgi:hypothetical protein